MIVLLALAAFLSAQSQESDSVRVLARHLSDSALVVVAQRRPMDTREALGGMFARAVAGSAVARDSEIVAARRVALAYATAWRDTFLVRQVSRFVSASEQWRRAKVAGDSVRRAGAKAYDERGPASAIPLWRRAVARATAIGDTAGAAASLGNIGAAYSRLGRVDSAARYLERARAWAVAVGDVRVQANAIGELAGVDEAREDFAAARAHYADALPLRERIGDTRGLAADYNNIGLLAQRTGDRAAARRQFDAALALNRRNGRDVDAATNLLNLAGLASQNGGGDFARADSLYRESLDIWRAHSRWPDVADALHGLAQLMIRRGDYAAARTTLRDALALYNQSGLLDDALTVRQELAGALAASGDLQGAVDELRRVQRLADSAAVSPVTRAGVALARADLATQLNAHAEAARLYEAAEKLYRRAGDREREAEALQGRAQLLLGEDDAEHARPLLTAALSAQRAAGNVRGAALTRLALGQVLLRRGDTASARREMAAAFTQLDRLDDPVAAAAALAERASLEMAAGSSSAAESFLSAGLAKVNGLVAPQVAWLLHANLGALRQKQGAIEAAARELRAAIADIERAGRSLALAERRSGFLTDKSDVYVQLALLEHTRGRAADAFEVSERIRARELLELLTQGRVASPADASADLVAREQDLRRNIAELTGALESRDASRLRGPDVSTPGNEVTREALVRAQGAYTDLLIEVRERAPRHAALVTPDGASWRDVSRRLGSSEAFVEYLVSDATTLAFVITHDTVTAIDLGVGRHALAKTIDFVRGTLQPRDSRLDSLWRAPLRQLNQQLIAPLERSGALAGKTRLIVVPHAELHYLPFAALLDRATGRYAAERYEIATTPSASVWLALSARAAGRDGVGTLVFAPRPDALPASKDEVSAIARHGGAGVRVVMGANASEDAFRREAPGRRVLHLATYGILNKQNPLFSFVDLAPGGGQDGRLEAHEVFGLHLSAELVVLSACQTALGSGATSDVPAGDDWVGLTRAFLHAGATRVVASLWPVEDRATAMLMEKFYERLDTSVPVATALAAAQRALLANPATAHPFYWAGFEVVGAP